MVFSIWLVLAFFIVRGLIQGQQEVRRNGASPTAEPPSLAPETVLKINRTLGLLAVIGVLVAAVVARLLKLLSPTDHLTIQARRGRYRTEARVGLAV